MASQTPRGRRSNLARSFFIVLCLLLPVAAEAQSARLLIGLIPEINIFKQKQRFQLLGEYLSEKTGRTIEFTILSRYGNLIESFTAEKMDGAFFGSFTGAMAIRKLGVIPLARPVNLDGSSTYHGLLLVRKDSGITSAETMRGKRMAYVDKATTAGYLFPLAYLRNQEADGLAGFFAETFFTGSHDAAIVAVLDDRADIAAAKNTVYDRLEKTDSRIGMELRIVARSPSVPSNGLCVRPDLPVALQDELRQALLELENSQAGRKVLTEFDARRFIETTGADYQPVFDMATQAGIDILKYSYLNE